MTITLEALETAAGRRCYDHVRDLFADAEVPVLDCSQAQGDLLIVPVSRTAGGGAVGVPAEGVDVIRPTDGGHAHTLVAPDGGCRVTLRDSGSTDDLVIAVIETTEPVFLLHAEHGGTGLAPGCWEVRGQREFDAERERRVAD